jgi:hypothetical protein
MASDGHNSSGYGGAFEEGDYSRPGPEEENPSRNEEVIESSGEEEKESLDQEEKGSFGEEAKEPSGEEAQDSSLVEVEDGAGAAIEVVYPGGEAFRSPPLREEGKKKVGFTFRTSVAKRLSAFQSVLKLTGEEAPTEKGEIVEAALDLFLRNWEAKGTESSALQWLRRRGR